MHDIDHIVWDWNGTLLGDSRALIAATVDAFAECGLPPVTLADYQRHHVQPIPLFYERLAGRSLTGDEQARLAECFLVAYARHRRAVTLTADATVALRRWAAAGRGQSLLSMYPHADLVPLVTTLGVAPFFARIDGSVGADVAHKAPHLARHLELLDLKPDRVLLVGDSVDDARAAAACGVRCLLYHAGDDALHARDHFAGLGVPVIGSLREAVEVALASE
ncbi:phosphoglycolate phosphatase-like HAD superfamily hydrolase [Actinoplanes octamycinicus]|uniref:Phosphoglycolate phosphatase-like HAD superfamily hydrolase n=1 Tax=Actinoplanes octamycinicus TaxID=135948 RepID=A0A7W7H4E5_9ACTN|nr:HAD family hydrolase [Actinoplanes octamycinicus]MBB4743682.1 phosphoglycolate phosphatase-like HAD superfamily hydrolase [Actinoplanes octamycinicus]GIE61108.1 phosphatase [Actinoplanes octamycinicus]